MKCDIRLFVFGVLCVLLSCSKSDDANKAAPTVNYSQELKATFFTEGQSAPTQVNWHGDVGRFGLQEAIEGLTIDEKTGIVSWGKLLPPGVHSINIIAYNNAGTTTIPVTIENPLHGRFRGDLFPAVYEIGNTDFMIEFDFKKDGSLSGSTQLKNSEGDTVGPYEFFGNFNVEKNEVSGSFQYEEVADPIPFGGSINQTEQKAVLTGGYFPENDCEYCTTFELELVVGQ